MASRFEAIESNAVSKVESVDVSSTAAFATYETAAVPPFISGKSRSSFL